MCLLIFSQESRTLASSSKVETTDQADELNSRWLKHQCDRVWCEAEHAKREALDAKKQAKVLHTLSTDTLSYTAYFSSGLIQILVLTHYYSMHGFTIYCLLKLGNFTHCNGTVNMPFSQV